MKEEIVFHDIKPLPKFSNWSESFSQIVIATIILIVTYFLILALIKIFSKKKSHIEIITPLELAVSNIAQYEELQKSKNITTQDFASGISYSIRKYFEDELHFSALEQTSREVSKNFLNAFFSETTNCPSKPVSIEESEKINLELRRIFSLLDAQIFSTLKEESINPKIKISTDSIELLNKIDSCLQLSRTSELMEDSRESKKLA